MTTTTCIPETKAAAPRQRRKGPGTTIAWLAVSLLLLWAAAGVFLYVAPASDAPKHADVLFVLGPPDSRMTYAERLMDQGYAGTLAVSVPLDKRGLPSLALCNERRTYRIICFHPEPFTTQGEARALQSLSQENGWKSADVLTAQFHITRARVIVQRCYEGDLSMVAFQQKLPLVSFTKPEASWVYQYAYQTAAFVKVALREGC
ncbi:YdcF family protein [Arthrobacter sp. PAMC25564]|uniref:YdcF family protein n=1 Tax=Arthrobacter sp. PAMC25564 TaxID=2565366 RepID=UPI0010A228DC|nr:YdcF family protein [Arthrobacter sp. PAMC25564]QCB97106.1 YdcF family protein [Arthrobacter sp. PAMC25564]